MNQTVIRSSLTEQTYMLIINKIQNNQISQGDRLNIEELAKEFNVSRTPVREAINRLIQEGFVEQVHNSGPRIITLSKQQMLDLIFANATLFTGVLESLVNTNEREQIIAELTDTIEKQRKSLEKDNMDKYFLYAIEFHKIFINHCENQKLKQLTLQTQTQIDMFVLYYLKDNLNRQKSIEDHQELLNYFIKQDYVNLVACMKEHNLSAQRYFETQQ